MTRHSNELEEREENLKEEINRLQKQIEKEKIALIVANQRHEKDVADKERHTLIKLEQQRNEVAIQWEQKLRQECSRLKAELEQINAEEKHLAVELVKVQKEQEYLGMKKKWEDKVQECMHEVSL